LEFTAKASDPVKYVICNADEGEPGTFKDREIMEGDPHSLIEGMIIAAFSTKASYGYIYIRGEYDLSINRLEKAINDARNYGLLGENILGSGFNFDIEIKKGAGAYICGEETALIESIEGKRGEPRKKPPYPPTCGLWGKPTVINNVETLVNIPPIIENGADWYKRFGVAGSYGTKVFSLMGDLNWKGIIEIPFGTPLSYIVNEIGGGVKEGKKLKGVILGGVSGSLITLEQLDTPVDFNSLATIEAGPGSGAIIAFDEDRCIVDIVKNIAYFFRHESCGKCTPCRVGTEQIYEIIDWITKGEGRISDLDTLEKLGDDLKLTSFCGLGQTAPNIIVQSLAKFTIEWIEHIKEKKCRAGVCQMTLEEVKNG
jgi:NADH:ubiquinone oxidoreductase subunit F (NADH-binding)